MKLDDSAIAILGASLRQISSKLMKSGGNSARPHKQRLWYQGNEPYFDVTIETMDGDITWFQITLRGQVVSWQASQSHLQTGETDELDVPPDVAYYAASKLIRDGAAVNWSFVDLIHKILTHRPDEPALVAVNNLLKHHLENSVAPD